MTPGIWAYLYIMKHSKSIEKRLIQNGAKAASRQEFIAQGGNDGRYRERIIRDKKKEARKNGWEN